MPTATEANVKTKSHNLPKTFTAYALKQIDGYCWALIELRIKDGQITDVNIDVESTKEIKCNKAFDLLMRQTRHG